MTSVIIRIVACKALRLDHLAKSNKLRAGACTYSCYTILLVNSKNKNIDNVTFYESCFQVPHVPQQLHWYDLKGYWRARAAQPGQLQDSQGSCRTAAGQPGPDILKIGSWIASFEHEYNSMNLMNSWWLLGNPTPEQSVMHSGHSVRVRANAIWRCMRRDLKIKFNCTCS